MSDAVYQVGTSIDVRAMHVMPGVDGPEGQLHSHDYRIEVIAERGALGADGMVCDLDVLDAALADIATYVRDENLEKIRPEQAEAVTVEVFAHWVHGALAAVLQGGGTEELTVRVWESPLAFGGYRAQIDDGSDPSRLR